MFNMKLKRIVGFIALLFAAGFSSISLAQTAGGHRQPDLPPGICDGVQAPAGNKVSSRVYARGVQIYWVSINSNKQGARNFATDEDIQAFAQKNNLRLTVLRDPEQTAYKAFGLDAVPTVLILGRDGSIQHKQVGIGTEQGEGYAEIIKALEQTLK